MNIDARLRELGITLPQAAAPVAAYVPVVIDGRHAYVSGQLPFVNGELVVYAVGVSRSTPTGEIEKFDSWFYCEPY